MRQFDVFENPASRPGLTPYVVLLTSHHLVLEAVIVAPLIRRSEPVDRAELPMRFGHDAYILSLISMAAIEPRRLRGAVGSLAEHEDAIQRGLQRLFTGF